MMLHLDGVFSFHKNLLTVLPGVPVSLMFTQVRWMYKKQRGVGHWWLLPVILAVWEAEIWRVLVRGQLGK
jgi:hypothetical protein